MNVRLFAPQEFWEAAPGVRKAVAGGCGAGKVGDYFVPDTLYGLSVKAACSIHDWMYATGETLADKEAADRAFLNNMNRIIEAATRRVWLKMLRRSRAAKYYWAVKHFGAGAFWKDKNCPEEFREVDTADPFGEFPLSRA